VKNKKDPRHLRRIKNMQAIYAQSFSSANSLDSQDLTKIISHLKKIDQIIELNAPKWPLDKINKIDLSVLRTTVWELLYHKKTPPKVVIDEAVEIAKEFGAQSSSSFVNGVLGSIVKNLKIIENIKND
jgi:N utilization substance protein B